MIDQIQLLEDELYRLDVAPFLKNGCLWYRVKRRLTFYIERYGRSITLEAGDEFDGATYAIDFFSLHWFVHDKMLYTWKWDDGTPITVWQSSMTLNDICKLEGRPAMGRFRGTLTYGFQIIKRPFRRKVAA